LTLSAIAAGLYFAYRAMQPAGPPTSPPEAPTSPARELAERLPDFSLPSLDGETLSIDSWPGQALVVNFWATWCPPCLREIPLLKEFKHTHDGRIQVVGIAVDQRAPVEAFAADIEFNYPVLIGQSDAMDAATAFGVDFVGLPFTVFADASGALLGVRTGELHPEHLDEFAHVVAERAAGRMSSEDARRRLAGQM
jgi:thiol-disulfide isomerase/thioredoxin